MRSAKLDEMVKGWFVGAFDQSVLRSDACEVAVKRYKKGDKERKHFHQLSVEITVVVSGSIQMCNRFWGEGDIIVVEPGEATDFLALTDSINVVVKFPSVAGDKYFLENF